MRGNWLLHKLDIVAFELIDRLDGLFWRPGGIRVHPQCGGGHLADGPDDRQIIALAQLDLLNRKIARLTCAARDRLWSINADSVRGVWRPLRIHTQQLVQWYAKSLADEIVDSHVDGGLGSHVAAKRVIHPGDDVFDEHRIIAQRSMQIAECDQDALALLAVVPTGSGLAHAEDAVRLNVYQDVFGGILHAARDTERCLERKIERLRGQIHRVCAASCR